MREFGKVQTAFWRHPKIVLLSTDARLLALYLVTGPHSNAVGAYFLPDAYIADDFGWPSETVAETLSEVFQIGFAKRFGDGRHIAICDFLDWNKPENPNVIKKMIKEFDQLPQDDCRYYPLMGILRHTSWVPAGDRKRFETLRETLSQGLSKGLPEPFRKPEPSLALALAGGNSESTNQPPSSSNSENLVDVSPRANAQEISPGSAPVTQAVTSPGSTEETPESPEARGNALARRIGDHASRMRAKGAKGWGDTEDVIRLRPEGDGPGEASGRESGPDGTKPNGADTDGETAVPIARAAAAG